MAMEEQDKNLLVKSLEQQPIARPAPKSGIFGPKQPAGPDPAMMKIASEMNDLARRLRMIEERYVNFRRKNQVTEQDMVTTHRSLNKEVKSLMSEVSDLRKSIIEIEGTMRLVLSELSNCARKEDVLVMQKYLAMWEPVNFVTEEGLKRALKEKYKN